jgi:hypothetical protein
MISVLSIVAAAFLATACVIIVDGDDDEVTVDTNQRGNCSAAEYGYLVGKAESDIDRRKLPSAFRIVCHDCNVTMDHNPNRLNIQLDAGGKVSAVTCG